MPHPYVELSVFRVTGLEEPAVRAIGDDVASQRQKPLVGRGDVNTGHIRRVGLDVVPAEPPPRHAHITGWPVLGGNPKEDKGRQKLIAMQLVVGAKLVLAG